jgi:hypothetical protein
VSEKHDQSGDVLTFHFCPTDGSTVYWENEGFPDPPPLPLKTSPIRISRVRRFGGEANIDFGGVTVCFVLLF